MYIHEIVNVYKGGKMDFKNLRILLTCNLGASTGIMANKMKEVVENSDSLKNNNVHIEAQPGEMLDSIIDNFDIILVAPQMMHRYKAFETIAKSNGKVITPIKPEDYGTVNAKNMIKTALLAYMEANDE